MSYQQINLKIDVSDEAMVGGDGWSGLDPDASTRAYIRLVREAVEAAYPDAVVHITRTNDKNSVDVDGDGLEGRDEEIIYDIMQDVYSDLKWQVVAEDETAE